MASNSNQIEKEKKFFDTIIIGGGPAGLSAGLYTARAKMNVVLLERGMAGGQVASTGFVENYPGVRKVTGMDLAQIMEEQAKGFGLQIEMCNVKCISKEDDKFCVTSSCANYYSDTLILTTGVKPRLLGVPGEKEYKGKGVSYCAICDGFFYNGKKVAVIGGGDSAVEEGEYLTKFAEKVYIIHRRGSLRAQKVLQENAFENPKIEFIWNTVVEEIKADDEGFVNGLVLKNREENRVYQFPVDGVFIYIGTQPNNFLCNLHLKTDEMGFVETDDLMKTNVPGLFAAGDIRSKMLRQIVTAVSDGAIAAVASEKYIETLKHKRRVLEKEKKKVSRF
ncbi:MAG: thioredoxin-disulfide reductase [Vulcanimicrobiota bacterium]